MPDAQDDESWVARAMLNTVQNVLRPDQISDSSSHRCAICMEEDVTDPCDTEPCGHRQGCWNCVRRWMIRHGNCALCRELTRRIVRVSTGDFLTDEQAYAQRGSSRTESEVSYEPTFEDHVHQLLYEGAIETPEIMEELVTQWGMEQVGELGFQQRLDEWVDEGLISQEARRTLSPSWLRRLYDDQGQLRPGGPARRAAVDGPLSGDSLNRALERRRSVYSHHRFSRHIGSNRHSKYREVTPQRFLRDPELVSRARKWIRRELLVFPFLKPTSLGSVRNQRPCRSRMMNMARRRAQNSEFLLEYIIAILKTVDLAGSAGEAENMISEYLGRHDTQVFIHELRSWLRSPFSDLRDWDMAAEYEGEIRPEWLDADGDWWHGESHRNSRHPQEETGRQVDRNRRGLRYHRRQGTDISFGPSTIS